jgi:hypothetical protein
VPDVLYSDSLSFVYRWRCFLWGDDLQSGRQRSWHN